MNIPMWLIWLLALVTVFWIGFRVGAWAFASAVKQGKVDLFLKSLGWQKGQGGK